MAEITINGVKYTNVPNKKAGTKFAASLTQSNIGASQAVQDYVNSSYFYPLVNAIDINWNGVEVDENSYINSTSDLITYIATKGSNVDLTSYATKNYVDQKIEDVVGGAPETLDTLKELADALANDATLAYVTEALDGKADKSSLDDYATVAYVTTELEKKADLSDIPSAPDLTPYATVSYVTEELDKKVDISDIPVIPDMTNYVTYTDANSYYLSKENKSDLYEWNPDSTSYILNNPFKLSTGNYPDFIIGKNNQFTATNHVGNFICGGNNNTIQGLGAHNNVIIGSNHLIDGALSSIVIGNNNIIRRSGGAALGHFNLWNGDTIFSIGNGTNDIFRSNIFEIHESGNIYIVNDNNYSCLQTILSNKANLSDIPSAPDLTPYATVSYVTTELENKADISDIPDMTNYVDVTSYNALYTEVQHLAYLISYYHPSSPDPGPGPDPGQQFEGYWTLNGVRTDSITLSETDPAVTLSFVSNPTIASGIGTWTFYDMNPKVIINTSTGEMTINPSLLGAGVYNGAGYLYENGQRYPTSFNITITITSASKSPATGYFVDGNGNFVNTPLVWSDEGGELDGMSATLVSEPASGWTGPEVTSTDDNLLNSYTISGNTITFGNIQSPPNVSTFTWSYLGDSLYDMGSVELKVVGLQYGADTQFFPDCGSSSTIQIPAETDVFYFNLINRTGIDHLQHPISVSSDNQNITVTSGPGDSFYITNTSTGTYQSANITATITDGNDTHTTSFYIDFLPSQPTQEYTNVSILYDVFETQTTDLPQGTFDTNPFEIGSGNMGSSLIAHVEFNGPEYDMNNFNNDFTLTRDTSYAGNHTTVYMPQFPNGNIYNIYNNGVNTITFNLGIYTWQGSDETNDGPGTNRDVLTFTHNGYNYLTDGIKSHAAPGAS